MDTIEAIVDGLASVRDGGGRLFILGVGGGAGHASHAVNDFRKICHLESYAPTDNVSELTARINDDGWETAYAAWLQRLAHRRERRGARVQRRRRLARARRVDEPRRRARTSRARSARGSTGSSASPTARPRESADACVVVAGPARATARRTSSPSRPSSGTWSSPTRGSAAQARQVGDRLADDARRSSSTATAWSTSRCWDARTESFESPYRPEDVALVPGRRRRAARRLRDAGYTLVLVSNQPAAAKGHATRRGAGRRARTRGAKLLRSAGVQLDGWLLLPSPSRTSPARATAASRRPGCCCAPPTSSELRARATSWMIGDADTDVAAAHAAGARGGAASSTRAPRIAARAPSPDHTAPDLARRGADRR